MNHHFLIVATIAAVLGCALFAAGTTWDVVQRFTQDGDVPLSEEAQGGAYTLEMGILAAAVVLLALGLLGIYLAYADRLGVAGLVTTLMAFTGAVLVFGLLFFEAAFMPWLAEAAPAVVDGDGGPDAIYAVSFTTFIVGLLALCITMLVRGVPSRLAAGITAFGLVGDFFFEGWLAPVMGVGLVWMAWLAYAKVRTNTRAPLAVPAQLPQTL